MVRLNALDAVLVRPDEASVSVAVRLWLPSASFEVVTDQAPLALAVVVPTRVEPS